MELNQSYDLLKVTNGQFRPWDEATKAYLEAKALGCVGALGMEADVRSITKVCEGVVEEEITLINFYTVTITGHMPIGVIRDIFGLSNDGLRPGVYAIGQNTRGKKGVFTFEGQDMYGVQKKFMAYPKMSVTSGYAFSHENGLDEIAEIEIEFKAMKDSLGKFYYEAYEEELTDEEVKTGWAKTFDQTLVTPIIP